MDAKTASASLHERIELIKRVGNAQLDYLQRLYDPCPIAERYVNGDLDVHLHFARLAHKGGGCIICHRGSDGNRCDETPMLVYIRQKLEGLHPVASIVRLQPLDQCHVFIADAFEIGRPVFLKELWAIFNRKLNATVRRATGINLRELSDEIIETAPQCVSESADDGSNIGKHVVEEIGDLVPSIRVILDNATVTVEISRECDLGLQLRQVLVCPPELSLDFI